MNITMNRAELLSAAQKAGAIASEDAPLEPLKGALLETNAAANTLTITATNMEVSLEQKLSCAIGAPAKASFSFRGERKGKGTQQGIPEGCPLRSGLCPDDDALVVNAKLLAGMLELLPGDTVELKRTPGVPVLSLRGGEAGYDVSISERGCFPKVQIPFPEDTVKVSGVPSMTRRTTFATVEDKEKPMLRCVKLMFTQEGLKGVGSNGGCVVTAKGDDTSTGSATFFLPAPSLEKLSALCADQDEFQVGVNGGSMIFMRPGLMFSARLMEGDYLDTERVMANIQNQFTVLSDVAELRRVLKTVDAVDPKGRVKLAFQGEQLTFFCKGDLGAASESLDVVPLTGTPQGEYWYLVPGLRAGLKALSGTATLGIAQAGMLDLSTEHAYYMQTAVRPPAAAPMKAKRPAKVRKAASKAKQPKETAATKAA